MYVYQYTGPTVTMYYVKCVPCVALGSDTQGTHKTQNLILHPVLWSENRNHYRRKLPI